MIIPELWPVDIADIDELDKRVPVPEQLRAFWLASGYGFFMDRDDGTRISRWTSNRLLHPNQVLELYDWDWDEVVDQIQHGFPFMEANDYRFLLIGFSGEVIMAEGEPRAVAPSFDEFIARVKVQPFFYDGDEDA